LSELPTPVSALRGATLADGAVVDVELAGGIVTAVRPADPDAALAPADLDLRGWVLVTAPADPHAHLDKARSWDAIRPPMGDLELAIASWRAHTRTMDEADIAARARAQALAMLANGTTAVRTHVDILTTGDALRGVRALVAVRDELADLMDLELVALAGPEAPDADIEAALDAGVDVVGGVPHLAADPLADLRRLLAIAQRRGAPVDLHTDESLDGPDTLHELARIVRGWPQNVSAGHCVRLGMMSPDELAPVIDEVVASRVGIIANPITNLYLQGWEHPSATPRGLTALRELLAAGARVAAGADNVRDPFNPLGRGDALETAMLLVVAGHLTIDEAYHLVADGAREVMGLPSAGPVVGGAAELLAVRAGSLAEVVASAPADRIVIHAGRVVARSELRQTVATPASHLLEAAR
jgi:cytosine/creatinine deaminase